ncbi:MAG: glycosyltransferase family 4 protein [Methanomicrobiaceae archaeon]|nr:glycosyltransferase family 4 protein [Methanomicrobiaceae archaeon]
MKVVIASYYWQSHHGGGINTYVTNFVDHLRKELPSHDIIVVFADGIDEHNYQIPKNPVLSIFGIFWVLNKIKPNVIHVHESFEMLLGAAAYCTLHNEIRLINTFHTEPTKTTCLIKKLVRLVKNSVYRWALEQCHYVSFVSKALEKKIGSTFGYIRHPKVMITYAGVDIKNVSHDELDNFREKFNLNPSDIIILAQALTSPKPKAEGLKLLVYCMNLLKSKYANIKLLVTKNGTYRKELEDYAKDNDVQDRVIFTGDLENPFVALNAADILCHITKAEGGVSLSILEAMIIGKPIIASNIGGIPEAISNKENGLLVDNNPQSILDAICRLIEDKELARLLGQNAEKKAKAKFDWDETIKTTINMYMGKVGPNINEMKCNSWRRTKN